MTPTPSAPFGSTPPIRVVYILGCGRSGSTVLDTILADAPQAVGVGELGGLHRAVSVNNEYCACGERGRTCSFWSTVLRRWHERTRPKGGEPLRLQQKFERLGPRQLVRLAWQRLRSSAEFRRHLEFTRQLYQAVADVSAKSIIVDSSKNPLRAYIASRLTGVDLRIVHLVRDGRAVAWSVQKSLAKDEAGGVPHSLPARPAWRTICYWTVVNLASGWVRRHGAANSIVLRYEDLVRDPITALDQLGRVTGLDLSATAHKIAAGRALRVGHAIAGNRLRMAGSVRLEPDWQWTEKLTAGDRRICWLIAGWLLRRFGYARDVSPPDAGQRDTLSTAHFPEHKAA